MMSGTVIKKMNMLVVDDDRSILKFFKIHLGNTFSSVVVVSTKKEGVKLITTYPIDLIITDYDLPQSDGYSLMKAVKKYDHTIPVACISGMPFVKSDEEDILTEFDGFLSKPFDIDELGELIDNMVRIRKHNLAGLCEVVSLKDHPLTQAKRQKVAQLKTTHPAKIRKSS
ncbi:MAG: response regulator [Proteobacteria bacterium]|nr:response regulator [Pseudomonadota bacterium]